MEVMQSIHHLLNGVDLMIISPLSIVTLLLYSEEITSPPSLYSDKIDLITSLYSNGVTI